MSLITCPKCGKENVSSTAQWCPECGFHINSYLYQQEQLRRIEKVEEEPLKQLEESQDSKKINKEAKEYFKTELCKYILMLIISSALSAVFITLICNAVKFMSFDYFLQEGFWFLCFIATTLFTLYLFIYACICLKETINQRKNKIDFYLKKNNSRIQTAKKEIIENSLPYHSGKKGMCRNCGCDFSAKPKTSGFCPECGIKLNLHDVEYKTIVCPRCGNADIWNIKLLSDKGHRNEYRCTVCGKIFKF